jgi:hypothetical protein
LRFRQFQFSVPIEDSRPFLAGAGPFRVVVEHSLDCDRFIGPFEKLVIDIRPDRATDQYEVFEGVGVVDLARPIDPRLAGPQDAARTAAGELIDVAVTVIERQVEWPDAARFRELGARLAEHRGPYVLELCRTKPRGRAQEVVTWLRTDEDESAVYHTGPGGCRQDDPIVVTRFEAGRPLWWVFPVRRCVVRGDQIAYLRSDGSLIATAPTEPSAG